MKRLIAILIASTITLTGCSSLTSKEEAHKHHTKNTVEEKLTNCLYCDEDGSLHELFNYPTYYEVKKGSYHEDCYRKLLDEKRPDDNSECYEMVVCTNCNEYGELIKDWVAYGHYETECTNCKGKLEIKKFATYEDFLMRNGEVKEEIKKEQPKQEIAKNESEFDTCSLCGISNAGVCYHDGIHGYFSGDYYCEPCYAAVYKRYEAEVDEWEEYEHTCKYCGDKDIHYPIEWFDGDGLLTSGYYHGVCYSNLLERTKRELGLYDFTYEYDDYDYENATVYCPSCGYETGEYGQQYLYNHNSVDCPQCGNTMIEHDIGY